ncbi:MAG: hypothetical protein AAGM67_09110, partial [Bacteroidota bacterium]
GSRFKIKGFPTLILFSKGQMYSYRGKRDLESLKLFANGGFKKMGGKSVPGNPTLASQAKDFVSNLGSESEKIVKGDNR